MLGWKPVYSNTSVCWHPNDDEKYNYQISMVKRIQKAFRRWRFKNGYYQINKVILIQKAWRQYAKSEKVISEKVISKAEDYLDTDYKKHLHLETPWRPLTPRELKRWHYPNSPPSPEKQQTASDFYPKKTVSDLYIMMLDNPRLSDEQRTKIIKMRERRKHRMSNID